LAGQHQIEAMGRSTDETEAIAKSNDDATIPSRGRGDVVTPKAAETRLIIQVMEEWPASIGLRHQQGAPAEMGLVVRW